MVVAAASVALLGAACSRGTDAERAPLDSASHTYVGLALALGERDSDSLDSYRGPSSWRAEAQAEHASLAQIRARAAALARSLEAIASDDRLDDAPRRAFLIGQLQAIASRIDVLQGARPAFDEEARLQFGLDAKDITRDQPAQIRAALDRMLPGRGDLTARYAAFDRQFLVPADRVAAVFERALAGCRASTREHVTLPPGERVTVDYVRGLPWSAFTRYEGRYASRVTVNAALPLTVDRVLDLACHETYPGHHTIAVLLESRYGDRRPEFLVQLLFSPQSALHEAAASLAPELAFPDARRTAFERDELFPLAGLDPSGAGRHVAVARLVDRLHGVVGDIVRRYLDGAIDFPRAAAALESEAVMPSPEATLKFVNQFRSYAATYTAGRDRLFRSVDGRWDAYVQAATDPTQALPPIAVSSR
jgi:hypothetical protein